MWEQIKSLDEARSINEKELIINYPTDETKPDTTGPTGNEKNSSRYSVERKMVDGLEVVNVNETGASEMYMPRLIHWDELVSGKWYKQPS